MVLLLSARFSLSVLQPDLKVWQAGRLCRTRDGLSELLTMLTLTSGTAFIMWLGEQITERGIGNGISLIIFAGIVARFPNAIISTIRLVQAGELSIFFVIFLVVMMVAVIGCDYIYGKRTEEDPCSVCKEGCRAKSLRRAVHASASED